MRTLLNSCDEKTTAAHSRRGPGGIYVLLLAAALVLSAGPALAAAGTITEKDKGGTFHYQVGAKFQVDAPHPGDVFVIPKPTFNPKVLRLTARQDPPEPGKPGRVVFTFSVIGPGQTTLLVRYVNPDDREAPPVEILRVTLKATR